MEKSYISYGKFAKFLHWAIAVLIIWNFVEGLYLKSNGLYNFHKQTGVAVLILVILRIFWRITTSYPKMVESLSISEKFLAKAGHWLLYILMLVMPLSGILMSNAFGRPVHFLGFTLPPLLTEQPRESAMVFEKMHEVIAYSLITVVVLHALAALKHHFIDKNKVLVRMLPFHK